MAKSLRITLCLLFGSVWTISYGQEPALTDTTTLWRVETLDENEYIGRILSRDGETLRLETDQLGVITIRTAEIKALEPIDIGKIVDGKFWFDNPQATRYFWSPTGYGLRPGEGYYQNVWIFFNQVSIGVTENVSVGLGVVPLFLFAGASTPIWLTPKVSIPIQPERINLGAGALVGTVLGEENTGFGILYGSGTFGSRDRNVNFGLGYGYGGGEFASTPTVTLSGMLRTGRRGYLLTENYWIDAGGTTLLLLSAGGRYVGKSFSIDYGGFVPLAGDVETFIIIPWLGISVPIGKRSQGRR